LGQIVSRRFAAFSAFAVFVVLLVVYAFSSVETPFDSRWSIHTADSLLEGHGGDLSAYLPVLKKFDFYSIEYVDGRPHTIFPIGVSLLAAPFVAATELVDPSFKTRLQNELPARFEKVLASIFGAAAGALFFVLILDQFKRPGVALAAAFVFSLCTTMWSVATRALWQHGPLVLMFVIAMLLLQRARDKPALVQYVSLPLALAYIIRPTAAIAIVVISAFVLIQHRKWLLRYLAWATLFAIPWLAFNVEVYGQILSPYYLGLSYGGAGPPVFGTALAGNLISPSRGLFVYSPVLLVALPGFALSLSDRGQRSLHVAYGLIIVLMLGAASLISVWWAGHSYGPRYMTDLLPFLAYFGAFTFDMRTGGRRSAVFATMAVLAAISFGIHLRGATQWAPWFWNVYPDNIDQDPARLWDWRDPQFLRSKSPPQS
jgi:hypothetical protein